MDKIGIKGKSGKLEKMKKWIIFPKIEFLKNMDFWVVKERKRYKILIFLFLACMELDLLVFITINNMLLKC